MRTKLSTTQKTPTEVDKTGNRGESVVKNTGTVQGSTDGLVSKETGNGLVATPELSYEKIVFSNLLAKGITPTTAYRQAFPSKSKLAYNTVRQYAMQLCQDMSIIKEVASKRETMARLARLSEDRIEETLINGRQGSRAVTDVSMFIFDHANGKATQRTEITSKSVSVNIDLTQPLTEVEE